MQTAAQTVCHALHLGIAREMVRLHAARHRVAADGGDGLHHKTLARAHVLLGHADHELDTVELVDLARARVVVNGHDIALRVQTAQLLAHSLAHHMVGQAREGLRADDVRRTMVDQVEHLGSEQPTLAHVVAQGENLSRLVLHHGDGRGALEAIALLEYLVHGLAHPIHQADRSVHAGARRG